MHFLKKKEKKKKKASKGKTEAGIRKKEKKAKHMNVPKFLWIRVNDTALRWCWGHGEKGQEEHEQEGRSQPMAPTFYTGGDEAAAPGKPLGGCPGVFC